MATPVFAVAHHTAASAANAYNSDACMFVTHGGSPMLDDDDDDMGVFRSTSLPSSGVTFVPMHPSDVDSNAMMDDGLAACVTRSASSASPYFTRANQTVAFTSIDKIDKIEPVRVEFSSIAEDLPPIESTTQFKIEPVAPVRVAAIRPCGVEVAAATNSSSRCAAFVRADSRSGRRTPIIPRLALPVRSNDNDNDSGSDASLLSEDMPATYGTNASECEADVNRKSPFGPTVLQPPTLYAYNATKTEADDMERLRHSIQAEVFQRYFALEQHAPQWGTLEERDTRLIFHTGKRREAIMLEKKFHDASFREAFKHGMADSDAAWYHGRKAHFADEYRAFCRDETKYKQEMMLTRLEKASAFSMSPILANRFLLVQLLGKGGNGEVWTVVDYADNQRSCALKLSTSIKHAQHEHFTHSRLHHPNIVKVGSAAHVIEYRQVLYTAFTVDSVETDLQQLLDIYEQFDEVSALNVLRQLLSALTYLHNEKEIAHYDIKPSNILITDDECVQLTDFDLARDVHEPISSSSVGTLRYLPPECFRTHHRGSGGTAEKADIWMVGVVYCLMLWGKHPICRDKCSLDDAKQQITAYNGQLTNAQPMSNVSQWIIFGCLHPDPRCRPTALQLLQGIEAASIQLQQE